MNEKVPGIRRRSTERSYVVEHRSVPVGDHGQRRRPDRRDDLLRRWLQRLGDHPQRATPMTRLPTAGARSPTCRWPARSREPVQSAASCTSPAAGTPPAPQWLTPVPTIRATTPGRPWRRTRHRGPHRVPRSSTTSSTSSGVARTRRCTPSSSVVRYDPAADSWDTLAPYPHTTSWESCGGIDGKVYCAGGFAGGVPNTDGFVYDPAADAWSPIANMPFNLWGSAYSAANGHAADRQRPDRPVHDHQPGARLRPGGSDSWSAAAERTAPALPRRRRVRLLQARRLLRSPASARRRTAST